MLARPTLSLNCPPALTSPAAGRLIAAANGSTTSTSTDRKVRDGVFRPTSASPRLSR